MGLKHKTKSSKYHIVWTTKYRKRFLYRLTRYHVENSLKIKACEMGVRIENMEIMPDHVHLFVDIPITLSIANVIHQLKGYS